MPRGERGDNQRRILEFIRQYVSDRGFPPSVREIGQAVGLTSTSTVHGHLMRLEKKGLIRRDPMRPRAMEVMLDRASADLNDCKSVPMVGRVTAGAPILAIENIDEYVPLPPCMTGEGTYFILNVRGESMRGIGIMDGDNVVVRKQPDAQNGDIVVAMIDDEATVKRFYKEKGHFRLQPENPDMAPIFTDHVSILGKVVSLYRVM